MLHEMIGSNQADIGLEHFYWRGGDDKIIADGMVIDVEEDVAFRIHYTIGRVSFDVVTCQPA